MKDRFFKDYDELCKALTGKSIAEIEKELAPVEKDLKNEWHKIHSISTALCSNDGAPTIRADGKYTESVFR